MSLQLKELGIQSRLILYSRELPREMDHSVDFVLQELSWFVNSAFWGKKETNYIQSLYALLRNKAEPTEMDVEEAFDGNLCRCTGYRPLLDAAQSFSVPVTCCKLTGAKKGKGNVNDSSSVSGENNTSESSD